uniref:Reverse transcriptase domain-containing protein n=1 Tax=Tanacetum cinerariifolium TaxID=118510 RepID=A0A6L2MFL3_TANCI|nr:reverse transcriptase domain-containing protein [Tanacetum cinerariifolium]
MLHLRLMECGGQNRHVSWRGSTLSCWQPWRVMMRRLLAFQGQHAVVLAAIAGRIPIFHISSFLGKRILLGDDDILSMWLYLWLPMLSEGGIIQIFYHGLDEPTQEILDETARGIFLYKTPNQAFQFLDDKVLFKLDWSTKSQNEHHQKSTAFADGSNSNNDNSRLIDDGKTTGVSPNKKSKTINQEPQSETDFEKPITKFLDGQIVSNMFVKNNINDIILKMKQIEKNCQTIFKNLERKIDEWEKSQYFYSKQTDRTTPPPPPPARTEHVNALFTGSGKFDDPPKI